MKKLTYKLPSVFMASIVTAVALSSSVNSASAQEFPSRSISIIIPYSPGGSSDTVARAIGQEISKKTGHGLIVESRPGGNTVIGTNAMLSRPADGYTVSIAAASSVIVPRLLQNLPYDFEKDVAPVTRLYGNPHVLVVAEKTSPKNLNEFIKWVTDKSGHATYSSVGTGSSIHLGFERFNRQAGIKMSQIPYKGSVAAVMAVLSGEVDATLADVGTVVPHIQAGTLRALAVGGEKRSPSLPDVPTFSEAGLAGFTSQTWMGLITNANVPKDKIEKLNELFRHALLQPDVQKILAGQGVEANPTSPESFGEFMKTESKRFEEIIRQEKIALQ